MNLPQAGGVDLPLHRPLVQAPELHPQDGRLQVVHAGVRAGPLVVVALGLAMDAQLRQLAGQLVIVRRHHPAFT